MGDGWGGYRDGGEAVVGVGVGAEEEVVGVGTGEGGGGGVLKEVAAVVAILGGVGGRWGSMVVAAEVGRESPPRRRQGPYVCAPKR